MSVLFLLVVPGIARPGWGEPPAAAVLFLVDTSGSLSAGDRADIQGVARQHFAAMAAGEVAGLMTFGDRPELRCPLTRDEASFTAALGSLETGGRHSALHDALYDAARLLGQSGAGRRLVVLASDGSDETSALLFEDASRQLSENQVAVLAIGAGSLIDEGTLRRLAKLTGGEYLPRAMLEQADTVVRRIGELAAAGTDVPATAAPGGGAADRPGAAPPDTAPGAPAEEPQVGAGRIVTYGAGLLVLLGVVFALMRLRSRKEGTGPAAEVAPVPDLPDAGVTEGAAFETTPLLDDAQPAPAPPARSPEPVRAPAPAPAPEPIPVARPGSTPSLPARPREAGASTRPDPPRTTQFDRPGRRRGAGGELTEAIVDPLARTVTVNSMEALGGSLDAPPAAAGGRTAQLVEVPVLVIRGGGQAGTRYEPPFKSNLTVGRSAANDLVLKDTAVSSMHLRLVCRAGSLGIVDLNSTNGTFVNEVRIASHVETRLREGDIVRLGETRLEYKLERRQR